MTSTDPGLRMISQNIGVRLAIKYKYHASCKEIIIPWICFHHLYSLHSKPHCCFHLTQNILSNPPPKNSHVLTEKAQQQKRQTNTVLEKQ